jgi:A/G-specific adenine glycosylase
MDENIMNNTQFKKLIWNFYKTNKRDLPWRETTDPYKIFLSEVMLQQTQVSRVLIKYPEFLSIFPNFETLASATLHEVLLAWQGMGYNRRGKYLKESSEIVVNKFNSILPHDPETLVTFPGIGPNTAGSLVAFAYNKPTIFIETNIRRVFIHSFFSFGNAQDKQKIDDKDILKLVAETLDRTHPREWYYALMDYGSYLKTIIDNPNKKSKHYSRQSKFEGSTREVRSKILKSLLQNAKTKEELNKEIMDDRLDIILSGLINEGFVREEKGKYKITD